MKMGLRKPSPNKKRAKKFKRQEWFRFKRLGEKWRKPRGRDSKMRLCRKGKPAMPSTGARSPKALRGIHPSGFAEIRVNNPRELDGLSVKKQAVRIASSVGKRKREQILTRAKELGLKVLNPGGEKGEAKHAKKTSS